MEPRGADADVYCSVCTLCVCVCCVCMFVKCVQRASAGGTDRTVSVCNNTNSHRKKQSAQSLFPSDSCQDSVIKCHSLQSGAHTLGFTPGLQNYLQIYIKKSKYFCY